MVQMVNSSKEKDHTAGEITEIYGVKENTVRVWL